MGDAPRQRGNNEACRLTAAKRGKVRILAGSSNPYAAVTMTSGCVVRKLYELPLHPCGAG